MATARLYQRQGTYWIDLRQEGQPRRRKSLGTSNRREAEARRREEEARLVLQEAGAPLPEEPVGGPTFTAFYLDWLERVEDRLDPLTMASYERACREADTIIGDLPVADVRRVHARRVVKSLSNGRRQRSTVARLVAGLRACMADAVDAELTETNPFTRPGKLFDAAGLRSRLDPDEEDTESVQFYTPDCGTCLEYFKRKEALRIGKPTTMQDTVASMLSFGKVLTP